MQALVKHEGGHWPRLWRLVSLIYTYLRLYPDIYRIWRWSKVEVQVYYETYTWNPNPVKMPSILYRNPKTQNLDFRRTAPKWRVEELHFFKMGLTSPCHWLNNDPCHDAQLAGNIRDHLSRRPIRQASFEIVAVFLKGLWGVALDMLPGDLFKDGQCNVYAVIPMPNWDEDSRRRLQIAVQSAGISKAATVRYISQYQAALRAGIQDHESRLLRHFRVDFLSHLHGKC